MSPIRVLRVAWAGALIGAGAGFLYLAYAPLPGSYVTDRVLTIATALIGGLIGGLVETRIERRIAASRAGSMVTTSTDRPQHAVAR
jgi:hypothetical protein